MMTGTFARRTALLAGALVLATCATATADEIPIWGPNTHDHVESHTCSQHPPTHTCWVVLAPDPLHPLGTPSTQVLNLLEAGFSAYDFSPATRPLTGIFDVQTYIAMNRSVSECYLGAELSVNYNRGPNDPENLRFIQMVDYLVWDNTRRSDPGAAIDPRSGHEHHDDEPFYYDDELHTHFGLQFHDTPAVPCPCPSGYVSVYFELYMVSYDDATPFDIELHGGIGWGYDVYCTIPEPTTLALIGLGVLGLAAGRRGRPA